MSTGRLTDKDFKYVNSVATDIRETFKRARREIEAQRKARAEKVTDLPRRAVPGIRVKE